VKSPVFRKVSLERLSSPEQLDQLMFVTDSRGWIILLAFAIVLLTAVVWGILGSVPQNVSGMGILVKSGGVAEVIALAGGRIADVAVSAGDVVSEGQVVARISQPELEEQLREAKATLATVKAQHAQIVGYGSQDLALQGKLLQRQRSTVEQAIAASGESARWYREKIVIQEQLVQEGLLTKQTLLNTRQQLDGTEEKINDGQRQLAQIAVTELDLRNRRQDEVRSSFARVEQQERAISQLERDIKSNSEVVAHQTGRVLELLTEQGAVVGKGEAVLTLDQTGRTVKELEAIIFVPSAYGKQVRVGMSALIAPSTVKQEEYGLMLARVTYVSDYPATTRGLRRILKNDKLVSGLSGSDAPYELRADLLIDTDTVSKYKWSSSKGPPLRIQSGTLAMAQITVSARRPIEMVIPLIREYTGL
jgi:HlyD family secretion protein